MTADWLLGWHNLIFLVPLGLALAYLFAYALSGWTFGDADVDVEADADADADAHAPRPDIDADSDVGPSHGLLASLTWLGVGRVPLSIVLMVLLLTFGLAGFAANELLRDAMHTSAVWVALPIAVVLSLAITSGVSQLIARYMPLSESSARALDSFVGRRGSVMFTVTPDAGTVVVTDPGGDRYQLPARTPATDGTPIAPGTEVILLTRNNGIFRVKPLDL